jgi:hypothetical protein
MSFAELLGRTSPHVLLYRAIEVGGRRGDRKLQAFEVGLGRDPGFIVQMETCPSVQGARCA